MYVCMHVCRPTYVREGKQQVTVCAYTLTINGKFPATDIRRRPRIRPSKRP